MADALIRPDVQHVQGAGDHDRELVEMVAARALAFEQGIGQDFKLNCEKWYRQYRGFRRWRDAWTCADPRDRDVFVADAKAEWGAQLHIPLSYRTIETLVPRACAQRPKLLYLPRSPQWERNVENVRLMIDSQQDQVDIELEFQDVMRNGFIYGLGVGKSLWRTEYATRRRVKERLFRPGSYYVGAQERVKTFDDPDFEAVDVFDFWWDPYGSSVASCKWIVHRVWLGLDDVMARLQSGAWATDTAKSLTEDQVRSMGGWQKFDDVWADRMNTSGLPSATSSPRGEHIHEAWEFHDGERVITVLDRQAVVQEAESQCLGHKPFHVYRPTKLTKQMVGISELEPLEHLQRELDTLRSQRRDTATMALMAGYAYDAAAIDEEDLTFGPAAAIPVTNGSPRDALFPLQVRDVPGSGYQEETVIRGDMDAVSGINDALAGGDGGVAATATEAQLVQASLSKRIEFKSRRFEVEVARTVARVWLYLDQRMIVKDRPPLRRQQDPGVDGSQGRWAWFNIGPGELEGEYEITPEGGSLAAENVPQNRQDAVQLMNLFGSNDLVDPGKVVVKALQLFGIKDPETFLAQGPAPVPPMALEVLKRMGVDPGMVDRAVQIASAQGRPAEPGAAQVNGFMASGDPNALAVVA